MSHKLSKDEYDALTLVGKLAKGVKPSACISRNSKRLTGIKLLAHRRDGGFELTAEGRAALFSQQCITCLRAIALDAASPVPEAVATFLAKKGYIGLDPETTLRQISVRGREVLADIDQQADKPARAVA